MIILNVDLAMNQKRSILEIEDNTLINIIKQAIRIYENGEDIVEYFENEIAPNFDKNIKNIIGNIIFGNMFFTGSVIDELKSYFHPIKNNAPFVIETEDNIYTFGFSEDQVYQTYGNWLAENM